jgi:hypothetical protein
MASLVVVLLAGISLELWRVVDEHRRLSGLAEGAALSGATALDVEALYAGEDVLRLDPTEATLRACNYVEAHAAMSCPEDADIEISGASIKVVVHSRVDLTLLRLVEPFGSEPINVAAQATATAMRSG